MSLSVTLRGWARRYGPEAAFVGRVAVAAFLPPGVNKLVESGLEAAFEYIQSQPERPPEGEPEERLLRERLTSIGVTEQQAQQLGELVTRLEANGALALHEASEASRAGQSYEQAEERLRALISSDPTLSAMRASLEELTRALSQLTAQGEVLIAGQAYQTEAIEEMMRMIQSIAAQVGVASAPAGIESPSQRLEGSSGLLETGTQGPSLSAPLLGRSAGSQSSAPLLTSPLTSSPSARPSLGSPLLGGLTPRPEGPTLSSPLSGAPSPSALSASALSGGGLSSALTPSLTPSVTPMSSARDLIERFYQMTGEMPERSVDLVARFRELTQAKASQREERLPSAGEGRVALTLNETGPQPISVVKWICEAWGFSLADAIIATQSPPVVLRRSDDFVALARAQRDLSALGASLKLTS